MPAPLFERAVRRDRLVVLLLLAVAIGASWAYILAGAGLGPAEMGMPAAVPGHSIAGMEAMGAAAAGPAAWTPSYAFLMLAMWWVMMAAMMLPGAAPMILLFAAVERRRRGGPPHVPTALFATGYLLVWGGFSLVAVGAQWAAARAGLIGHDMAVTPRALAGALLFAAGLYQLTPLKRSCLLRCREPARFLADHWRPGAGGAVRIGLVHGAYCLGCCGLIMALLFVGGIMNLVWIGALAVLVLVEKAAPSGRWVGTALGYALLAAGGWVLVGAA